MVRYEYDEEASAEWRMDVVHEVPEEGDPPDEDADEYDEDAADEDEPS